MYSQHQVIIGLLWGHSSGERNLRVLHCSSWTVWNFGCTCMDYVLSVRQRTVRGISFSIEYSITVESLAYHDSQRPRPEVPNNCRVTTDASQIITRSSHKHHMLIGRQKACCWPTLPWQRNPKVIRAPAGYTLVQYLAGRQYCCQQRV